MFAKIVLTLLLVGSVWAEIDVICPPDNDGYSYYLPDPYDCSKFFQCVGETPIHLQCPYPLYFDSTENVCNWPEEVECDPQDPPTEPPNDTTTEDDWTTGEDDWTTGDDDWTTEDDGTTEGDWTTEDTMTTQEGGTTGNGGNTEGDWSNLELEDREIDVVCPIDSQGFTTYIPHPYECSQFYVCEGSMPILLNCPDGLHFDPVYNVCNWPWDANCEAQPWPTTEEPSYTTTFPNGTTTEEPNFTTEESDGTSPENYWGF